MYFAVDNNIQKSQIIIISSEIKNQAIHKFKISSRSKFPLYGTLG